MTASIWSNNSDISLNCWRLTHFSFLLTAAIFDLICFCRTSSSAFLLLLNFLFTRGYFISSRIEIFHIIFFKSIYQVEILIRVENLHMFGPLVNANKSVTESLLILILNAFWFTVHVWGQSESSSVYRKAIPCFRLELRISGKRGDIYLRKMTHFL